uniref:Uncharacterized protein n=1 Tax=Amphimedon queenslandica TaxID=400682 RepID=A0A1X7UT21_AMPQE
MVASSGDLATDLMDCYCGEHTCTPKLVSAPYFTILMLLDSFTPVTVIKCVHNDGGGTPSECHIMPQVVHGTGDEGLMYFS